MVNNNLKAFTLIEVVLAIFILSIAVSGAFTLISQTLNAATLAQSKLIASYLAQEGVEIVENIRNTNWLAHIDDPDVSWQDNLNGGDWQIDYKNQKLAYGISGNFLNIDDGGFYSYSPGTPTLFKRKISILNYENNIEVMVDVSWAQNGATYHSKVLQNLSNWYEERYE